MAVSQGQREEQKEMKQSVRVDTLQGASKQGSTSESPVESTANSHQNRSQAVADRTPASYPTTPSYSYYYPSYDASVGGDFYNRGYYVAGNAIDSQYPVVQTDGSIIYMMPAVYSGYDPHTSYMPVSPISVDGQYVGQQVYPSSPVFQSPEYSLASLPNGDLVQTPYFLNSSNLLPGFGNGFVGVLGTTSSKHNFYSATVGTNLVAKPSKLSNPSSNLSLEVITRNEKQKPFNKPSSCVSSLYSDSAAQGYYGMEKFPYHNQGSSGLLYSNNSVASKLSVKGWVGPEKPKARTNLVDNAKMVNEKSHGPVTVNANCSRVNSAESKSSGDEKGIAEVASQVKREQYNLAEFSTKYDHALFFVIKSYSEDDIHKSIKYNVWASTPNGNKRLSIAFQEAQDKIAKTGTKCPIFLFFSVNASGQFCGVAEMTGQVDFSKNMDFWQQSKWNGYFPVKWHIIKDIPNSQLRHVILQNNENKPLTNSRDTQEVKFHRGIDVLSVFKNYTSATSILDDFDFYENRQKIMQEKRLRQSVYHHDLQVKVDELTT